MDVERARDQMTNRAFGLLEPVDQGRFHRDYDGRNISFEGTRVASLHELNGSLIVCLNNDRNGRWFPSYPQLTITKDDVESGAQSIARAMRSALAT